MNISNGNNTLRLAIGFASVLIMMGILMIIALTQMSELHQQLDKIVKNSVVKIELANKIITSLREQTISLYFVSTTKDPLQRGQEFERLSDYGLKFDKALQALISLEDDSRKKEIITTVKNKITSLETHIDLASEYVFVGDVTLAHDIIRSKVLPAHRYITEKLDQLIERQRRENEKTVDTTTSSYDNAKFQLLALGSSCFSVSLFIAIFVSLQANNQTKVLTHQALHDNLTGLATRALYDNHLELCLQKSVRSGESFAVIVMDLDGFKQVNDTLGHKAGDQILVETASRLNATLRDYDTIARMGGDEFFLLLVHSNLDNTIGVIDRIARKIGEPVVINNDAVSVGVSIGIAVYPDHGTSADQLIKEADKAMYIAKRNKLGYFVAELNNEENSNTVNDFTI